MGAYEKSTDVNQIAAVYEKYRENPKKLTTEQLAEVMLDLQSGNTHSYISYLKDIVDEECDQSVRAGVLIERPKAYELEIIKDLEPMVYVNFCEESDLMNPRCQKLSEFQEVNGYWKWTWRYCKSVEVTKNTNWQSSISK